MRQEASVSKNFYNQLAGYDLDATYVTREKLSKLDVVYYFTQFDEDSGLGWDIFRDDNYDNFYYTEN